MGKDAATEVEETLMKHLDPDLTLLVADELRFKMEASFAWFSLVQRTLLP